MHDRSLSRMAVVPLLVALLVTACGSGTTPGAPSATASTVGATVPGVTGTEVVVGSWGPQDGPAGFYGAIDRTLDAYFKMINDQGGINGRKIRFIYENDSYQPAKTVAAVKKLVEEDKVFALCGGLGTPNNAAVMDYVVATRPKRRSRRSTRSISWVRRRSPSSIRTMHSAKRDWTPSRPS
ncbi:MAG: hypothetical protein E6I40_00675 [Chloroflexi bacterium]|nr:MAG: hypothetical protein E6I40_00675 [Chloroflexota bacterium]